MLAAGRRAQHSRAAASMVGAPFARLLANLIIMGTGVVSRAFVQAYQQALKSERRSHTTSSHPALPLHTCRLAADGTAAAGSAAARGAAKNSAVEAEARQILNVKPKATEAEVQEVCAGAPTTRYVLPPRLSPQASERLTQMNDPEKGGSAYLQAKIAFARDALIKKKPPEPEAPGELRLPSEAPR